MVLDMLLHCKKCIIGVTHQHLLPVVHEHYFYKLIIQVDSNMLNVLQLQVNAPQNAATFLKRPDHNCDIIKCF